MAKVVYDKVEHKGACVVIRSFHGSVQVDEIIDSFKHIQTHLFCEKVMGIVTNMEFAELQFNLMELQKVIGYINQVNELKNMKLAVIVNTPQKTVFPIFAEAKTAETPIKPFSTVEAALEWICVS
jgi:hypothetical protein